MAADEGLVRLRGTLSNQANKKPDMSSKETQKTEGEREGIADESA